MLGSKGMEWWSSVGSGRLNALRNGSGIVRAAGRGGHQLVPAAPAAVTAGCARSARRAGLRRTAALRSQLAHLGSHWNQHYGWRPQWGRQGAAWQGSMPSSPSDRRRASLYPLACHVAPPARLCPFNYSEANSTWPSTNCLQYSNRTRWWAAGMLSRPATRHAHALLGVCLLPSCPTSAKLVLRFFAIQSIRKALDFKNCPC